LKRHRFEFIVILMLNPANRIMLEIKVGTNSVVDKKFQQIRWKLLKTQGCVFI
jgi:hypothetical protein